MIKENSSFALFLLHRNKITKRKHLNLTQELIAQVIEEVRTVMKTVIIIMIAMLTNIKIKH